MKPVDQTTFGVPGGNCFSACVASLLELPIEAVPYFMEDTSWWTSFEDWLRPHGYYPMHLSRPPGGWDGWCPKGFCILGGPCSRGSHSVVGMGFGTVHDPHPSRESISSIQDVTLFISFDPRSCL